MGFSRAHAIKALQATNNNLERAVDWLFSHQEDLANEMDVDKPAEEAPKSAKVEFDKGPARTFYCLLFTITLFTFISV